jgi:hypothetical protein
MGRGAETERTEQTGATPGGEKNEKGPFSVGKLLFPSRLERQQKIKCLK